MRKLLTPRPPGHFQLPISTLASGACSDLPDSWKVNQAPHVSVGTALSAEQRLLAVGALVSPSVSRSTGTITPRVSAVIASRTKTESGFTLLEVMVATAIMAIAVVALLGGLTQSVTNAARLRERDVVVGLARQQLNELMLEPRLPHDRPLEGRWAARQLGPGMEAGWTARITAMTLQAPEIPPLPGQRMRPVLVPLPAPVPAQVLDRIEFEAWWTAGGRRRTLALETYKRGVIAPELP